MAPPDTAYLRLRIDAGQEPTEIDGDIDVYVSLPGGDEDNLEPQLNVRFTDEGVNIDVLESGACVGSSSETYAEVAKRLTPVQRQAGDIDLTPHENGLPGGKYPRTWCGCGSELIYTPEGWQHDSAPYLWGDDHDSSVDADDDAIAARWQAAFDAQNEV